MKPSILNRKPSILKRIQDHFIVQRASAFAAAKHIKQKRKYTGEPYWNHLHEVASLVKSVNQPAHVIAAAYLHDTVEDTPTTNDEIKKKFGAKVAQLVHEVTDQSMSMFNKKGDNYYNSEGKLMNREARKKIDREHLAKASSEGATIKLADFISNTKSIAKHDPHFAKRYLAEKAAILPHLKHGNPKLYKMALKDTPDGE
jgi:(p)ppGpp synthase/HD superfamily hydrolase